MTLTMDALHLLEPADGAGRATQTFRAGQPGFQPSPAHLQSAPLASGLSLPALGSPLTLRALLPSDRSPDKVGTKMGVAVSLGPCFLEPVSCQDLQLPGVRQ